jgi:hypothetical protein
MSSDGNNELAYEYPVGAIADSPVPFSQENPINTPVNVPIPIVDFTTLQPLSAAAPVFSPQPVSASSSASEVANMFRQLRVHMPAPLTPDGQHVADQASKMFVVLLTPAQGRSNEASSDLASSSVARSEATLGATTTTANSSRQDPYDSSTDNDLRRSARCGEQREYCHGHTPVIPNPTLNLPPRIPVSGSLSTNGVARFNLNHTQATALASRLIDSLEQDHQNATAVPPPYDPTDEFTHVLAEGLGLRQAQVAEGLGLHGGRGTVRGQNGDRRPCAVPDARQPTQTSQAQT